MTETRRVMQMAAHSAVRVDDPTAQDTVDSMASLIASPTPETFVRDMTAAYEKGDPSFFESLNQIAMVVPIGLAAIAAAARASRGAILEIGPYVGASTIAISLGLKTTARSFLTVEAGGSSSHPTRGSDDILRDLKANIAAAGASERVAVIEGWAQEACEALDQRLGGEKVGLLFVDADGAVDEHLNAAKHVLSPNCLLVFDDWLSEGKGDRVRSTVEKLVERDAIVAFGVLGDTWFGRLNGEQGLLSLSAVQQFQPDSGHAFWATCVYPPTASDDQAGDRSTLQLLEDGRPLGPGHTLHQTIRENGRGAFSHWRGRILFSASDNSDPRDNGKRYTARFDGHEVALN